MRIKILFLITSIFSILFIAIQSLISNAAPLSNYRPANEVTVQMYELTEEGVQKSTRCSVGNTNWGCTAFCNNFSRVCVPGETKPYPYDNNPQTVQIETDYLLDVIAQEVSVGSFHPLAIKAQTIAARSYTNKEHTI